MIRLHRPSPSMTVALIALFVALGGTGYAAIKLPKNSVGTPQIKKNAVTSAKVKNGSLTKSDFKAGQLPAGAQGPKGDKGDKGDPGANGTNGTNGADGGLVATLPSGKTERGAWGVGGTNHLQANDISEAPISFPIPLATTPTREVIQAGGLPTAHCPGSPTNPQAAPGYFCLYVGYADQVSGSGVDVYGTDASSEFRWGGVVYINENSTSYAEAAGTWAVTAP